MAVLAIGYDVESLGKPEVTRAFLKAAISVHSQTKTQATMFCVGRTIEESPTEFLSAYSTGLFDIQQHTYSHVLLKSVYQNDGHKLSFYKGGSIQQIKEEVARAKDVIQRVIGIDAIGLCGPYCYYRGLADRPDILEILHELGIKFTRTWGRNEVDWQPVPFTIQPFSYQLQGYPHIYEIPLQGWQDCIWRDINGWEDTALYLEHLKACLTEIAQTNLIWSYCQHDWSSLRHDPELTVMKGLLEYALSLGIEVKTHLSIWQESMSV